MLSTRWRGSQVLEWNGLRGLTTSLGLAGRKGGLISVEPEVKGNEENSQHPINGGLKHLDDMDVDSNVCLLGTRDGRIGGIYAMIVGGCSVSFKEKITKAIVDICERMYC